MFGLLRRGLPSKLKKMHGVKPAVPAIRTRAD